MSDPVTALQGARYVGAIQIAERPAQGMITLRGDLTDKAIVKAATAASGTKMPGVRGAFAEGARGLLWMSPDEAMILCPYAEVADTLTALQKALAGRHALAADVSDARAVLRLEGAGVRDVLAKVTPADLRPDALPVGELRRTRLAQVASAFWFEDAQTVHLICFRSVAQYVFDLLSTSASPDAELGYFTA